MPALGNVPRVTPGRLVLKHRLFTTIAAVLLGKYYSLALTFYNFEKLALERHIVTVWAQEVKLKS